MCDPLGSVCNNDKEEKELVPNCEKETKVKKSGASSWQQFNLDSSHV